MAKIVFSADDNTVRTLEVTDGGAFAQEFRVGNHGKAMRGAAFTQDALHLITRTDRNGRLGDDDGIIGEVLTHFLRHRIDKGQVRVAITPAAGCADRDKDGAGILDTFGQIRGEGEATGLDVLGHQRVQARFVDRHHVIVKGRDLGLVLVDAHHIMAKIGKARP